MTKIFLYAISAIVTFAIYYTLRGREAKGLQYIQRYSLGLAVAAVIAAFDKSPEYEFGIWLLAGVGIMIFINLGVLAYNAIFKGAAFLGFGKSDNGAAGDHIRGARLVDGLQLQKILKKEKADLTVGAQKIPVRLEALHFLIAGTTGVGKSVAISEMLDGIAERGDRVFLADAGGNFLKSYYRPERGDIILNPFDARAVNWSPLAEMESAWDADQIAKSIVPNGDGGSKEWNQYAQTIASAILRHCWENNLTNADIFRIAVVADIEELREIFAGTPAQALTAEGNERMFGSIRGIVATYITPFQYLDPAAGVDNGFSLKTITQSEKANNWLFFNFRDDQLETLAPIIAAMTDIISKSILSMDADSSRKFWLILDEFASLGRITSILDFLTKARKNGGRAVIGLQTVSQLEIPYTRAEAHTILANCSSQIVFRVPDPETSDIISRMLGDQQISRVVQSGGESSQSMSFSKNQSENWSQQITTERVIMPAQLQNMETLNAILNLAGDIPAAPILLEPRDRAKVAATFEKATRQAIKIAVPAKVETDKVKMPEYETVKDDDLPDFNSADLI